MSEIDLGIDGLVDIETIGRGGSAAVYRARQVALDRVVAVKVLMSAWDADVRRRFDRECRSMGKLSDDVGVVPIYESGETASGAPYIVMPYYPAGSLQDEMNRNGPFAWREAAQHIKIVAETIAAANENGVIHRDIKPANLLLSSEGKPRVSDFGIARHIADEQLANSTSTPLFTPAYCAPESFANNSAAPTVDVYGLGSTFWALLAGHAPFKSKGEKVDMMTVFARVANDPVGDLRHVAPDAICALVERAVAKRPEQRPQDARAFVAELNVAVKEAEKEPERRSLAAIGGALPESMISLSSPADSAVDNSVPAESGRLSEALFFPRGPAALLESVPKHPTPRPEGSLGSEELHNQGFPRRQVIQPRNPATDRGPSAAFWVRHLPKLLIALGFVMVLSLLVAIAVVQRPESSPSVQGERTQQEVAAGDGQLQIQGLAAMGISETSVSVEFSTSSCAISSLSGSGVPSSQTPGWPDDYAECSSQHLHTLNGLQNGREYVVTVQVAAEELDLVVETIEFTAGFLAFDSAPAVAALTETSATIKFDTATCTVAEFAGENLGRYAEPGWPDATSGCSDSHEHRFEGLQPDTNYSAEITVLDVEGRRTKVPLEFRTSAGGFGISDFRVSQVGERTAAVSFVTSRCSDARFFGSAGVYFEDGWTDVDVACSTRHSYVHTALRPDTEYTVEVEARNEADGATARSQSPLVFRTLPAKIVPRVIEARASGAANSGQVLVTSDVCTVVRLLVDGRTFDSGNWSSPSASSCSETHGITVNGLDPSSSYASTLTAKTVEGVESAVGALTIATSSALAVNDIESQVVDQTIAISFEAPRCSTYQVGLVPRNGVADQRGDCSEGRITVIFDAVPTGSYRANVQVAASREAASGSTNFSVSSIDG